MSKADLEDKARKELVEPKLEMLSHRFRVRRTKRFFDKPR
jgi:hypothetical protein